MKRLKISESIFLLAIAFLCFKALLGGSETNSKMTDDEITANIQKKYLQDTSLQGQEIKISTQNGNVTLNGNVETATQAEAAVRNAKSISGVKHVDSYINSFSLYMQ